MFCRCTIAAIVAIPAALWGQEPAKRDSLAHHRDSLSHARPPLQLQEVTVTAAPTSAEAPFTSLRIQSLTLRRTPATNAWDLMRQVAGIEVHEQGQGPGFASTASIRGFSSDHSTDIALWVDGVPINEPVNGHAEGYNDWNLLFPQAIRDIEVTKGPSNPFYGNFAMAGAVNIRTLERLRGAQFWASGGSYGRFEGGFLTGVDDDRTGAVIGVRAETNSGWRPNSHYDLGQGHARWVRQLSGTTTIDAGLGLYATGWDSPGFLSAAEFAAGDFTKISDPTDGGFKHRAQERVSLRVLAGPNLLWRTTLFSTESRWQLFLTIPPEGGGGEGSGSQTEEEDHRYGIGASSALTLALSRSEVTVGIESRYDHSMYENFFTTRRLRDSVQTSVTGQQSSGGAFLQTSTDLGRHFRLNVGGRFDLLHQTSATDSGSSGGTKGLVSPKIGLLYHLPGVAEFFVNIARGFRQSDGVIRDPGLPFITSWNYEGGIKYNSTGVSATLSAFLIDVSNEQTFDPIHLISTNGGQSRRKGIDLDLNASLTPAWRLTVNATLTDAKYRHQVTADGDSLDGKPVFNTAKYVGGASVEYGAPSGREFVRIGGSVVGPYSPVDEPGVELPTYFLANVSGGIQVHRGLQLQVGVKNLTNHNYPEIRAGGFVVPGQPRSLIATLRYDR